MAKEKQIRVRGVRRRELDEDKIALAYVLLARTILAGMDEDEAAESSADSDGDSTSV